MNAACASYARSLEVRDRIAGAGATTTAAGLAMGAPVMAAVKSYTSMEDAMKGVAKQVNGLRDDNGNRTARFYEMQDAIKGASEQLPMENGAVDFAALVEGGARMNVANPDDSCRPFNGLRHRRRSSFRRSQDKVRRILRGRWPASLMNVNAG